MKKTLLIAMAMIVSSLSLFLRAEDQRIDQTQLPQEARMFIARHFPSDEILYAEQDKGMFSTDYEVVLKSGARIEFDSRGNWIEVSSRKVAVPTSLIPAKISQYVGSNYPGRNIREITREGSKYEVELTGGTDLVFGSKGEFLRVDD